MADLCEKCGATMVLVQPYNPAKARCPQCGHELDFLGDPAPPEDPDGDADGLLIIESFNGNETVAAIEFRRSLNLTPPEALALVKQQPLQIPATWGKELSRLFRLKERLDLLGVSSRIERTHFKHK